MFSDRPLVRDLILDFLRHHGFPRARPGEGSVGSASVLPAVGPAVAIVDLGMEKQDPEALLRELRLHRAGVAIIAIGTTPQLAALALEADGWIELRESADRLVALARIVSSSARHDQRVASIRLARHLRVWRTLTARQRQILALLACGLTNHKLARALDITERTVKAHVAVLLDKFKADNRTELALIASRAGLRDKAGPAPFMA